MTQTTPQRLYLFQLSTSDVPIGGGRILPMVAACYLVQMSDGKNVLIDTGLAADYQRPAGMPPAENAKNVLEHLAAIGLQPDSIHIVIATHFDVDHAGYHDSFPQAEFIVQRSHYEAAKAGDPRFTEARHHWDHPALKYRLVEGDTEILPGLWVIETSGHAPGHQSVLVYLPNSGPVLLVIDAVIIQRLFTVERPSLPEEGSVEEVRASTRKLLDLVAREQIQLIVFGHDGEQWRTLKKSPEYYE
jgi:N-acyl homoserine lactone hydrolase